MITVSITCHCGWVINFSQDSYLVCPGCGSGYNVTRTQTGDGSYNGYSITATYKNQKPAKRSRFSVKNHHEQFITITLKNRNTQENEDKNIWNTI